MPMFGCVLLRKNHQVVTRYRRANVYRKTVAYLLLGSLSKVQPLLHPFLSHPGPRHPLLFSVNCPHWVVRPERPVDARSTSV